MKYRNFNIEDYLTDPQFIDWVKHPSTEKNLFWEAWMRTDPEHRVKILKAREILLSIDFQYLEPQEEDARQVLSNILQGRKPARSEKKREAKLYQQNKWIKPTLLRAAVLALCIMGAVVWVNYEDEGQRREEKVQVVQVSKKNPKGKKSLIQLPDGSRVWLNADSEIIYPDGFQGDVREVALQGEAFFEVVKDQRKPFVVRSGGVVTRALGTSFNVRAFAGEDEVAVALVNGKVKVERKGVKGNLQCMILTPGEKVTHHLSDHTFSRQKLNFDSDINWKEGVLYFDNASFKEVTRRLELWYDVEVIATEGPFDPWHYDGYFKDSSIDRVLERLAYVQDFTYKMKGRKVYVKF